MGVSTNIYAVWGLKLPWNDALNEALDEKYDDPRAPTLIVDGMGGDYMVAGTVLFDSGDFRWGCDGGMDNAEIDPESFPRMEAEYRQRWMETYPELAHLIDGPFRLVVFTHYS